MAAGPPTSSTPSPSPRPGRGGSPPPRSPRPVPWLGAGSSFVPRNPPCRLIRSAGEVVPDMASDPKIRASDADRDRTAALLREHHAAGRLTAEEFNERLDKAYAAKTVGE